MECNWLSFDFCRNRRSLLPVTPFRRNCNRCQCWFGNWKNVLYKMYAPSGRRNSSVCSNRRTKHSCSGLPIYYYFNCNQYSNHSSVDTFFNTLFHWRRYSPFVLSKEFRKDYYQVVNEPVDHAYFVYALSQMDTFIDVTEDDLLKIYHLATERKVNLNK